MKLDKALRIALPLVTVKGKHEHYARVVELSEKLYRPMITGKGAEHLIERFNKREDAEAYQQRLRLTVLITPSITNTLMAPARKIPKVKPVIDTCTYGSDAKKMNDAIHGAISTFYSGKNVDHYFGSVLLDQGAIDPNAFSLTLFGDMGGHLDAEMLYPSIISCKDAWNFEYFNGLLQWLLVHRDIKYLEKKSPAKGSSRKEPSGKPSNKTEVWLDGHAFWMYTDQHHVLFTQVGSTTVAALTENMIIDKDGRPVKVDSIRMEAEGTYYYRVSNTELYEVRFYEHKAGMVQAFRIGFVPDQQTRGETMVNLWHAAVPFMLKGIKSGSELDLSAALHAFLQKISFENPCRGYFDKATHTHTECNNGYQPGGGEFCKACKGTGWETHTSGQDHLTLRMPRSKDELVTEISQMVHYVPLPVEVLEWQDRYVDKLESKCYRAVYNSDRLRADQQATSTGSDTATGDIINLQAIYDTLSPACSWYSQSRVLQYRLIGSFTNGAASVKKLKCAHSFPRNLRFETLGERVALLEKLRTSGASRSALAQVNRDILEDLYIDDPEALKRAIGMDLLDDFVGLSEGAVLAMISQDNTTKAKKVLWANQAGVFAECELRAAQQTGEDGEPVNFWDMEQAKQRAMVDEVVQEMIEQIEEEAEAAMEKQQLGLDPDAGGGGSEEDDVPRSPGSAQA